MKIGTILTETVDLLQINKLLSLKEINKITNKEIFFFVFLK